MHKKLFQRYKHAYIDGFHPEMEHYLWFKTDEGEYFGLLQSALKPEEIKLLIALFDRPKIDEKIRHMSPAESAWHAYLFQEGSLPLKENDGGVRFYYLYSKAPLDDKAAFSEALKGTLEDPIMFWRGNQKAVIVDTKAAGIADPELIKQLSDTLTSDFFIEPNFLLGQLHKIDHSLSGKFQKEYAFADALNDVSRRKLLTFYEALPLLLFARPGLINRGLLSEFFLEVLSDQELVGTLRVYMDCNLNASLAAKKLYMHRNSFQYRIDRFIERTGIDMKHFTEASAVHLILSNTDYFDER
ncbi:PucR family transcriptional regulator [Metabacillus sp. RGM 3146]|uniref:PucR family transcriptional regulator n=1 Tax=Metabacillus sp. RGM 3146 TaxID=3401092 RepID=UPI003B99B16D